LNRLKLNNSKDLKIHQKNFFVTTRFVKRLILSKLNGFTLKLFQTLNTFKNYDKLNGQLTFQTLNLFNIIHKRNRLTTSKKIKLVLQKIKNPYVKNFKSFA
jgi:hypothetical protein